jgi:hypothetical protein
LDIPKLKALASTHHTAYLGKTGSGKSNASKVVVEEQLLAGERVCIIDPTGAWWGLRLKPDGSPSPFKVVIFGGLHADVPITGDHGAVAAEVVATSSTPAIIDTRTMTVGERTRFFTDFAETLLRKNRGPLNLVIDEAHVFAPQGTRAADPQSGRMLHAANNLVSLGRSSGLRISLITQRPAKLHKDSLTQVETMVALRVIHPLDRGAVEAWVKEWADKKQGEEIVSSLPSLPTGDAWIWSPEAGILERYHFPLASTFDSGKPREDMPELQPIDLESVHALLGKAAEDIEANDPKLLKKRIGELENKVVAHAYAAPEWPDQRELVEKQDAEISRLFALNRELLERLAKIAELTPPPVPQVADAPPKPTFGEGLKRGEPPAEAWDKSRERAEKEKPKGDGELNAAALDLAGVLKGIPAGKSYAWDSLLVVGGYRPASGWIRKAHKALVENDLMEVEGAFVRPTAKLMDDSRIAPRRVPSPAELRALWEQKLRGPGGKMVAWLAKYGPATRREIAEGCGFAYTAGWTRKGLKDLLGSNLAREVADDKLAAHPLLVD